MFNLLSWEEIESEQHKAKIAKRLHDERKAHGYTLDKLITESGFSKPTVQSWEKGWEEQTGKNKLPSLQQLYILSNLYQCSFEYLLCLTPERTKPITDICKETGLTEQSINILHEHFSYELTHPSELFEFTPPQKYSPSSLFLLSDWRIDIFAFLNYIISHYNDFAHQLSTRRPLELLQKSYNELPQKKKNDLLKGYNFVISRFGNNAFASEHLIDQFIIPPALQEYFHSLGHNLEEAYELAQLVEQYFYILSPTILKRADFELSDTFMDVVKSFYASFSDNIKEYQSFVSKHIDPTQIQYDFNIIKSDDAENI